MDHAIPTACFEDDAIGVVPFFDDANALDH